MRLLDDDTALLDGSELTPGSAPPLADESGVVEGEAATPVATNRRASPSVSWLAMQLYGHCYVRPTPRSRATADTAVLHGFRLSLSDANAGRGCWESGWRFEGLRDRRTGAPTLTLVSRYGVTFAATADQVWTGHRDPAAGAPCRVLVPKERRRLHPGYYFLLGDASWPSAVEAHDLVRVYWNVSSDGAAAWVAAVTRILNRHGTPFWGKLRDHPDGHARADSAVLYLPRGRLADASEQLAAVQREIAGHLVDDVPMFTRRVAAGVGMAEDPGNGLSFGQHRCELVAHGLREHHAGGHADTPVARYEAIARAFDDVGLDPARPFLTRLDHDDFEPLGSAVGASTLLDHPPAAPADAADARRYLDAAILLGDLLCGAAYWDERGERCSWLGRTLDLAAIAQGGTTPRPMTTSLGPDLYHGQAGVALFLAELFGQTADERFRRTALGAAAGATALLRDAVAAGEAPGAGLYTGASGVAYAVARVASVTACAATAGALGEIGDLLIGSLAVEPVSIPSGPDPNDVVNGRAGAILTLLALAGTPVFRDREEPIVGMAIEVGRAMVGSLGAPRLTGFAHGAAGFGSTLLRLSARTGHAEFRDAGREILAWEDGLFDDRKRQWPDLRDRLPRAPARRRGPDAVTWCNGAAGIAISRLHAMTADPSRRDHYADRAAVALELTREALSVQLGVEDDASLCHGTSGLVETLLLGSAATHDPELAAAARAATDTLLDGGAWARQSTQDRVRAQPSLMLGAAGVGHQLLRLHEPEVVPSVLGGP